MSASAIGNSSDLGATLAVLVDRDPAGADRQELGELMARARRVRAFLDGRLAKFKIPERIIFSPESLPRLGTGKIDRPTLKAKYAR